MLAAGAALLLLLVPSADARARQSVPAAAKVRLRATAPGVPPRSRPLVRLRPSSSRGYRAAKEAANRGERAAGSVRRSRPGGQRASVFGGLNQGGLTASDGGGATPPDSTGAIGPSHYVELVNSAVGVYSRASLALIAGPQSLETFMGAPSGTFVTDPQIQWDEQGQRWVYAASAGTELSDPTGNPLGPNFVMIGFSKTSDPSDLTNGWC